jgi:hypothetical protein
VSRVRSATLSLAAVLLLMVVGCSDQPREYPLSGKVRFKDGTSVPAGTIVFEPDATRGNSGPGIMVEFRNGEFNTRSGQGVRGGAYLARVIGYDGVPVNELIYGKALFDEQTVAIDLPNAASQTEIIVPLDGPTFRHD